MGGRGTDNRRPGDDNCRKCSQGLALKIITRTENPDRTVSSKCIDLNLQEFYSRVGQKAIASKKGEEDAPGESNDSNRADPVEDFQGFRNQATSEGKQAFSIS